MGPLQPPCHKFEPRNSVKKDRKSIRQRGLKWHNRPLKLNWYVQEINCRKKNKKTKSTKHATETPIMVNEEIKEEVSKYLEASKNCNTPKSIGCTKSSFKREVYRDMGLPQETRKISNRQPNLPPKWFKKEEQKKPQKVGRREEIVKIRGEINKIHTQRKINKKDQWYRELFFWKDKNVNKP